MATSTCLLCVAVMAIAVLPQATDESLLFKRDNDDHRWRFNVHNLPDESMEVDAQGDGEDEESEGRSSEEEGGFGSVGSSSSIGSSIGAVPTDPHVLPGPVDPGQGGPDLGPGNPGVDPETPAPTMAPLPTRLPPVVPLTATPPRGDGGFGSFNPKQFDKLRPNPGPVKPNTDSNIAAISHEIEKPTYPNRLRVPLGALLTVVVIGGLVVVMAVGGVGYFVATRVRIS